MAADLPPEELRYQLDHIYEDKGPDCAAFYLVCTVLVIIFVGLRITCRLERKASFGADDWVFFAGATLTLGSFAVLLAYVFAAGLGTHWISLTPEQVILSGKIYYANTILSIVNYPLIKISILLLYKRIFVTPHIRIFAGLGVAFLALFTTACLFTVMFSCIPVRSYWDSTVSARCINTTKFFIAYTLINIGTDLYVLILPMRSVSRLQMPRGQKIALYVLFGVGSLTCVTSILLAVYYFRFNALDPLYNIGLNFALVAEATLAIMVACLPVVSSMVRRRVVGAFGRLSTGRHTSDSDKLGEPKTGP